MIVLGETDNPEIKVKNLPIPVIFLLTSIIIIKETMLYSSLEDSKDLII